MRITRTRYAVGNILCYGVLKALGALAQEPAGLLILMIISMGVAIWLAVGRLQDMDKNPWLSILVILPFVWLFFLFPKGTEGANKYGEDPRMRGKA